MNDLNTPYIIAEYALGAMTKARYVQLQDGSYYADVFLCPGVWATGDTIQDCRDELQDMLIEWLIAAYDEQDALPDITELAWLNPLWHWAGD